MVVNELEPPSCYKGFHLQEVIDAAIKCGITVTEIEAVPRIPEANGPGNPVWMLETCHARFMWYLARFDGVLLGQGRSHPHAVAYSFQEAKIYDPSGKSYLLSEASENYFTEVEAFLILDRSGIPARPNAGW